MEAIGYRKPKWVKLFESACDVVEIVFQDRQWCWNIMTPQEKEFWEQKKTQLEEKVCEGKEEESS